jgi:hypothetical protein
LALASVALYFEHVLLEEHMAIIDDYAAIAKRMRELNRTVASGKEPKLDRWQDMAAETARIYAQNRRTGPLADILMRRRKGAVSRR